jgi:hypothetical protein
MPERIGPEATATAHRREDASSRFRRDCYNTERLFSTQGAMMTDDERRRLKVAEWASLLAFGLIVGIVAARTYAPVLGQLRALWP